VEERLRWRYLDTMGIELWRLRQGQAPPPPAVASSTPPEISIEPGEALASPGNGAIPVPERVVPLGGVPIATLDWEALAVRVADCRDCGLHTTRTHTVFGVGDRHAGLMVIGEAPGAEEDRQGEPFVGRAGQLLDAMLRAIGLPRVQVFIANILKCRPPNNRDPRPDEVACCQPYLERQIEWVEPRVILCAGRIAAQNLLRLSDAVGRLRGRVHRYGARQIPTLVTYHPAYLLRSPEEKAKAWEDMQRVARLLGDGDSS
jgi:uracil-DNA glycosylase